MRRRELLQIPLVVGVKEHRRDGLDRQPALLGDDPDRFHGRTRRARSQSAPGLRPTRRRDTNWSGRGPGCRRPEPRPRPIRQIGHHLGTPQHVQLDQVGRNQFQARGRRFPSPVTGLRGIELRRSSRRAAVGVRYRMRSDAARMSAAAATSSGAVSRRSRAPSRRAAACSVRRHRRVAIPACPGGGWSPWRASRRTARPGRDRIRRSRSTARSGAESSPGSKLTGPRTPASAAAATRALKVAAPTATALAR